MKTFKSTTYCFKTAVMNTMTNLMKTSTYALKSNLEVNTGMIHFHQSVEAKGMISKTHSSNFIEIKTKTHSKG